MTLPARLISAYRTGVASARAGRRSGSSTGASARAARTGRASASGAGYPSRQRPAGHLVWVHGASIGETLSLLPVVERLTQRGLCGPRHLRHADLGRPHRPPPAAGRRAPVRAARRAALHPALPRSLAARPRARRRIRDLAEHDHRARSARRSRSSSSTGACRTARSGAGRAARGSIGALLDRFALCLAQTADGCRAARAARRAPRRRRGQPQIRRAAAARRSARGGAALRPDRRPAGLARGQHPSGRGRRHRRRAPGACDAPSPPPDHHRAAPSRIAGRRSPPSPSGPACAPAAARRASTRPGDRCLRRRHGRRDGAVLPALAARLHGRLARAASAGRTRSSRQSSAPPSCTAPTSTTSPTSTPPSTAARGALLVEDSATLARAVSELAEQPGADARHGARRGGSGAGARRRGRPHHAVDRALHRSGEARGAALMRAPAFWWHSSPYPAGTLLRPASLLYGAVAARRMRRRGRTGGAAGDLRRQLHGRRRRQDADRAMPSRDLLDAPARRPSS